ncbi:rhodanese-like domain-containing protein [Hydrogenobaculum acidophilum]
MEFHQNDSQRVLLDVRIDRKEFDKEKVMNVFSCKDYIYISFDEIVDRPDLENILDKSKEYFVICNSGNKSKYVVDMLKSLGFKAFNIEGGLKTLELALFSK